MNKFDTHLCLVSAQPTPNLIPTMDLSISPRRVVLATSKDMCKRADWLKSVMCRHGLVVEILEVPSPYDFTSCWEVFSEWLVSQKVDVALNVTGGTKVMAMAAQDVFREMKKTVFYINVENDSVVSLDNRNIEPFYISTKIKLKEYLESNGYSTNGDIRKPSINADQRNFVDRLAYESERFGVGFGQLNFLAQQAVGPLVSPELDEKQRDSRALNDLIDLFSAEGWLTLKNNKLEFANEAARQFVNGGWLEFLVYQSLANLSSELGFADYAIGLEVHAPDGKTKNEIDVAVLYKNTLHMIECKSANLGNNGKLEESSAVEALYKLDSLREIGGLRTRCLLVDFRGGLRDVDKRRAAQMKITLISGTQLRDLKGALKAWLK